MRCPVMATGPDPAASEPRPISPASTATAPSIPVTTSLIATPTLVAPPPSSSEAPVMLMSPLTAWITKS